MLILRTTLIAAAGAAVFAGLDLPLPFLLGPMAACLMAALAGIRLRQVQAVSSSVRIILGVSVGSAVTPALIAALPGMLATIVLIPIYLAVLAAIGVPFFTRVCGFDRVTAYYSAMPGGLQDMIAFGQEAGGDVRALSLIHVTRILVIVWLVPPVLTGVLGVTLDNPVGVPAADLPPGQMVLMLAAGAFGWWAAVRVGLFGASILGPLFASAALALTGVLQHRPPAEAIILAQFVIGMGVGVSYSGVTWAELRHIVASGIAFVLVLAAVAGITTLGIVRLGLAPPLEAFLAFAPGGQAEMTVLAIVTGADLGFVVFHHLLRITVVIVGAPIAARLFLDRRG